MKYFKGWQYITSAALKVLKDNGVQLPMNSPPRHLSGDEWDSFYCPDEVADLLTKRGGSPSCPSTLMTLEEWEERK